MLTILAKTTIGYCGISIEPTRSINEVARAKLRRKAVMKWEVHLMNVISSPLFYGEYKIKEQKMQNEKEKQTKDKKERLKQWVIILILLAVSILAIVHFFTRDPYLLQNVREFHGCP